MKMHDYTVTHFTPCDRVRAISKRLGFKELSTQLRILLPSRRSGRLEDRGARNLCFEEQAIAERLTGDDKRLFEDHQPYGVGHLLISDGRDFCYVLYTHVVRHRLPYCHVHYFSNREVFLKNEPAEATPKGCLTRLFS